MNARVRTAHRLTFRFRDGSVVGANPSNGAVRRIPQPIWNILRQSTEWTESDRIRRQLDDGVGDNQRAAEILKALVSDGFLLEEGSEAERAEATFSSNWPFGETTADHHLVTRSLRFSDDRTEAMDFGRALRDHAGDDLAPGVPEGATAVGLPAGSLGSGLTSSLERRRSRRDFIQEAVSLQDLSSVLWATAGIQSYREAPMRPPLPLSFAPSAGGLNGADCYVIVQNVEGISQGVYRYRPTSNALEVVSVDVRTNAMRLLGNQRWADTAAAIIVIVGAVARTAWKYNAASGFNALLLQAGHMSQNALLAAADKGLGAVPSNAIHAAEMEAALNLSAGEQIVLTSVSIGHINGATSSYQEYGDQHLDLLQKAATK